MHIGLKLHAYFRQLKRRFCNKRCMSAALFIDRIDCAEQNPNTDKLLSE
jgi:hypothetical protein